MPNPKVVPGNSVFVPITGTGNRPGRIDNTWMVQGPTTFAKSSAPGAWSVSARTVNVPSTAELGLWELATPHGLVSDMVSDVGYFDVVAIMVNLSATKNTVQTVGKEKFTVTAGAKGISPSFTYAWTISGLGGTILSGAGTDTVVVEWNAPATGTISCTVTDSASPTHNTATDSITLNGMVAGIATTLTGTPNGGETFLLAGSVAGGTAPYTYDWQTSVGTYSGQAVVASWPDRSGHPVYLTVTDANGNKAYAVAQTSGVIPGPKPPTCIPGQPRGTDTVDPKGNLTADCPYPDNRCNRAEGTPSSTPAVAPYTDYTPVGARPGVC